MIVLSILLIMFLVILGILILVSLVLSIGASLEKPIVLCGIVVKKNIVQYVQEDSYLTVETSTGEKLTLKFNTHSAAFPIQIRGEHFRNRAAKLDEAISLGDKVKIETFDKYGLIRDVYKLLAITKTY